MNKGFRDLKVWREAKELAVQVYKLSQTEKIKRDFGMKDQLTRAAVSVPSNIAEGDERDTQKDCIRFLYIAKGSLAELQTQLEIAAEVGLIEKDEQARLEQHSQKIGKMLGALIKARSAR